MTTGNTFDGKPSVENPHVRFDEREVASAATPRLWLPLYKMRMTFRTGILFSSLVAALIPPADAGVKYWDNPGFRTFDVGDYVQDGLAVNYDGIRNAGPNAPHDSSAMTWVNCANPGTYDMVRYSTNGTAVITGTGNANATKAWNNDAAHGSWTDYGFVFNKDACFHQPSSFAIPKTYTIQSLVDAKPGEQNGIGYIMCPYDANGWANCCYGMRSSGFNYGNGSPANTFYLVSGSIGKRPAVRGASAIRFSYMTAIQNVNDGVIFSETEAPWSATYSPDTSYGHAYDSSKTGTAYTYSNGFCIGGHYPRTDEMLKGTIMNYRFYNRCLSDAEVLWNRVVDEARYFGRGREITVIPVTNVVESFTIAGVRDYHYAIDAEGYTFTAPASKTVNGKRHVLSGYTLETWNGSAWDAPASRSGASYTATDTNALVRITWQYAEATGEGKLKTYDVGDYVTGADIHFDGIRNAGASVDHDPNATTWANLGSANMDLVRIKYGYGDLGGWDGDGYWFTDTPKFTNYIGRADWPQTYTVQALLDANGADQQRTSELYVYSVSYNRMAMAIYPARNDIQLHTQKATAAPYGPYLGGTISGYVNGIVDADAKTAAIFSGTEAPTSGNNFKSYETMDSAVGTSGIAIGGYGGNATYDLVGKIRSLRFYFNKVLTEGELEQNRKVDEYRFFGRYVVTNVIVASTYSYLEGYDKCGPYEVDGSYTFTAPESVTAPNGITYDCDGYIVEFQDGIGWTNATAYAGTSYLYNTSAGTVRLTWRWRASHGLRTAADYSIDDLSPAGLALHYDGEFNQGIGVARSTSSSAKWINLGSRPDMDLTRATSGSDAAAIGGWGDDGYNFGGKSQFNSPAGKQWPATFTAQVLCDAKHADNGDVDGTEKGWYIAATTWGQFGMVIYGKANSARFQVQGLGNSQNNPYFVTEEGIDYMTAIHDAKTKTATVFSGTKAPTGGAASDGYKSFSTFSGIENNQFRLGGWGGGPSSQNFKGTIYNFRYYDRVLTDEELIRNRNVDSVRYFGELGVTNVFVVAGGEGAVQAETGAYKVEGAWTFTAAKTVNKKGAVVDVVRYSTEELVNGEWKNKRTFKGNSYTYTEGIDPATVRLEWLGQPLGTMVMLQ